MTQLTKPDFQTDVPAFYLRHNRDQSLERVRELRDKYSARILGRATVLEQFAALGNLCDESDSDLRVAIVGSGGLWHTPGNPESYLNEEFDQECIEFVKAGDIKGFADHFDKHLDTPMDDYKDGKWVDGGTGMYNGLGSGTGETRNWIAAAATVDGVPGTLIDYIPLYASPIGTGFVKSITEPPTGLISPVGMPVLSTGV